jgi:hypothetical protein
MIGINQRLHSCLRRYEATSDEDYLILKRASASRPSGEWDATEMPIAKSYSHISQHLFDCATNGFGFRRAAFVPLECFFH